MENFPREDIQKIEIVIRTVAADGGAEVYCGRLMKKCRLDIAKVRLMASAREETKGRVWIQIDGWDG